MNLLGQISRKTLTGQVAKGSGAGSSAAVIPEYMKIEALRVVDDVTARQTARTINIGVMSDWHIYTEAITSNPASNNWTAAKHAIQAMALISKRIKLDAVACLGDYITGDTMLTVDGWLDVLGQFNEYMADIRTDNMIRTVGNHDLGYRGSIYIPAAKSRPYILGHNDHMTLGSLARGYGYKDLANYKVRLIVLNTCEFNSAADYSKSFIVTDEQYKWFAGALDLSTKGDASEWQTLILSHHPLDWSGSTFPAILAAYEGGSSVTVGGAVFNYSGKNATGIVGNIHGHLHNMLRGTITGTTINRWCVPNICYDYSNTYTGWKEDTTYPKTAGTKDDTAFYVFSINLDTCVVNRVHYGAGYSDLTIYGEGGGGVNGAADGYRLNSKGEVVEMSGRAVSGYVAAKFGDKIYATGIGWDNSLPNSNYIAFYDANFGCLQSVPEADFRGSLPDYMTAEGGIDGAYVASNWGEDLSETAYIRISGAAPVSGYNVDINAGAGDEYTITYSLTGMSSSADNPEKIAAGESLTLSFTKNEGYNLPKTINVQGAEYLWEYVGDTGVKVYLSDPTANVSVTITAEKATTPYVFFATTPASGEAEIPINSSLTLAFSLRYSDGTVTPWTDVEFDTTTRAYFDVNGTTITPKNAEVGQAYAVSASPIVNGETLELQDTITVTILAAAEYTNLVKTSVASNGSVYNGGLGYKDGYRLNSSGVEVALDGRSVTGFIPAVVGDVIRAANIGWDNNLPTSNYIAFYDANFTKLQSVQEGIMRGYGGSYDVNNEGFKLTMIDSYGGTSTKNMAYIRISGAAPGANFVVTKNEELA